MSDSRNIEAPDDQLNRDDPKVRLCLRCQTTFKSQWAGERICARCKGSTTWRSGIPVRAASAGNRR
jgi:protein-arginine kinase activator protein McsA